MDRIVTLAYGTTALVSRSAERWRQFVKMERGIAVGYARLNGTDWVE